MRHPPMANTGIDLVKKALNPDGFKDPLGLAIAIPEVATAQNKFAALASAVGSVVKWNLFGWAGAVAGGFVGIRTAITATIRESGSLEAAFRSLSQIRFYSTQLAPFIGGVNAARQRVAELAKEANKPFSLESLVTAERNLAVLTRGSFSGATALKGVSDAAARSGQDLRETSAEVGGLVAALKDGQPIDASAGALERMGVITSQTALHLGEMQRQGAPLLDMLASLQGDLGRAAGATAEASDQIEVLQTQYSAAREALSKNFGLAFADSEKKGLQNTIAALDNLAPVAKSVAGPLSQVVTIGNNVGSWIARVVTSLPGLSTAASVVTRSVIAMGIAMTAISTGRLLGYIGALTPTVVGMVRALTSGATAANLAAATSTRLAAASELQATAQALAADAAAAESAGNLALAESLNAAAASATRQALAQTVAGRATGLAAAGVSALTNGMRALLTATVLNPWFLLVAALTAVAGVTWHAVEAHQAHIKAAKDLANAGNEVVSSLNAQIAAMRNLDDQHQVLVDSTNALAEARGRLAEIELDPTKGHKEIDAQARVVRQLEKTVDRAGDATGLAPGKDQTALNQRLARQQVDVANAQYGTQMAVASPQEQMRLREERMADNSQKIEQGKTLVSERLNVEQQESAQGQVVRERQTVVDGLQKALDESKLPKDSVARRLNEDDLVSAKDSLQSARDDYEDIRLKSSSPVISGMAGVDFDERNNKVSHDEASRRRVALEAQRYDLEDGLERRQQEQPQIRTEQQQAQRARASSQIDLDTEKELAAIRARGMDAAEKEAAVRIGALQKQLDTQTYLDDQQREALQNRIDGENKALAAMREQGAFQRDMDARHMAAAATARAATLATAQGRMGDAARLNTRRIQQEDANANRESLAQKLSSGDYSPEQARAAVGAEQRQREADREAQRQSFLATTGRSLTEDELSMSRNGGDRRRARSMRDADKANSRIGEALQNGATPQEAYAYSMRAAKDDFTHDQREADRGGVVDSMQRIGGGGGIGAGDPMMTIAQRQADLQQQMVSFLEAIAKNGDDSSANGKSTEFPDAP